MVTRNYISRLCESNLSHLSPPPAMVRCRFRQPATAWKTAPREGRVFRRVTDHGSRKSGDAFTQSYAFRQSYQRRRLTQGYSSYGAHNSTESTPINKSFCRACGRAATTNTAPRLARHVDILICRAVSHERPAQKFVTAYCCFSSCNTENMNDIQMCSVI